MNTFPQNSGPISLTSFQQFKDISNSMCPQPSPWSFLISPFPLMVPHPYTCKRELLGSLQIKPNQRSPRYHFCPLLCNESQWTCLVSPFYVLQHAFLHSWPLCPLNQAGKHFAFKASESNNSSNPSEYPGKSRRKFWLNWKETCLDSRFRKTH